MNVVDERAGGIFLAIHGSRLVKVFSTDNFPVFRPFVEGTDAVVQNHERFAFPDTVGEYFFLFRCDFLPHMIENQHIIFTPVFWQKLVKSSREFYNLTGNIFSQAVKHLIESCFIVVMPASNNENPDWRFGINIFNTGQ